MGLREQKRIETRRRIAEAALTLAAQGERCIKPETIAGLAGISRRTFFNYVTNVDAAFMLPVEDFLEETIQKFRQRPAHEDVFQAMAAALGEMDAHSVARLSQFALLRLQDPAGIHQYLLVWEHSEKCVRDALSGRLGTQQDPLAVAALAAALMGVGRVAFDAWLAQVAIAPETELKPYLLRTLHLLAQPVLPKVGEQPHPKQEN